MASLHCLSPCVDMEMTMSSLASLAGGREASWSCCSSGTFLFLPLAFLTVAGGWVSPS